MPTFSKNKDGYLEIQPDAVVLENIVVSRGQASKSLEEAQAHLAKIENELTLAQENVTQKQEVVKKCDELGI